jgi:hypothetical protein
MVRVLPRRRQSGSAAANLRNGCIQSICGEAARAGALDGEEQMQEGMMSRRDLLIAPLCEAQVGRLAA